MFYLEKRVLSQFLRVRCDRYLHHTLYRKDPVEGVPLPLSGRPGVQVFTQRGNEFEAQKLEELEAVYGDAVVRLPKGKPAKGAAPDAPDKRFEKQLTKKDPARFLVEPSMSSAVFRAHLLGALPFEAPSNYPQLSAFRPDLVQRLLPHEHDVPFAIEASGNVVDIEPDDDRVRLRVIDLKATETLNASYAAEVVAYSMVLAAWLDARALSGRFLVVATPAVWSKSVLFADDAPDASADEAVKRLWLEEQLLEAEAELYAPPVVKFFVEDVPRVIAEPDWQKLDWGVRPTCSQCDYLGIKEWTRKPLGEARDKAAKLGWGTVPSLDHYCDAQSSAEKRISRIPGMTLGMRRAADGVGVAVLNDLADSDPDDDVYRAHHTLKQQARRLPGRARSILDRSSRARPGYKTAQMARYADLTITVVVNFDASSQLLTSLGLGLGYREPTGFGETLESRVEKRRVIPFLVDKESHGHEREQLVDFLHTIAELIRWIRDESTYSPEGALSARDRKRRADGTKVQVLFWNANQETALRRAIGRHLLYLSSREVLHGAIWLFPPDEVVRSDRTAATSMIAYLQDVATGVYALPTVYNDDIISVEAAVAGTKRRISPYDWDRIGGAIPKERALELWRGVPPKTPPKSLSECAQQYRDTTKDLVYAMEAVAVTIRKDHPEMLGGRPPKITDILPTGFQGVAPDARIWLTQHAVNEGISRLETNANFVSDPHEVEARYGALRTIGRLPASEAAKHLERLGLSSYPGLLVLRTRPDSRQVKFRRGEGFLALVPEAPVGSALATVRQFMGLSHGDPFPFDGMHWEGRLQFETMAKLMDAKLIDFDRSHDVAVIELSSYRREYGRCRADLIDGGHLDLDRPMSLVQREGPATFDVLRQAAVAIGRPISATPARATSAALMSARIRPPTRFSADTSASNVLWAPDRLVDEASDVHGASSWPALRSELHRSLAQPPNESQQRAVQQCLDRRLCLVWGGPGTGKTWTLLQAIVADAVLRARKTGRSRTLVTTVAYRALGEIVERLGTWMSMLPEPLHDEIMQQTTLSFWVSPNRLADLAIEGGIVGGLDTVVYGHEDNSSVLENGVASYGDAPRARFCEELRIGTDGIEIVFAPSRQVLKTFEQCGPDRVHSLFDRIWVDESSQLAVVDALPALALLDEQGCVGVFGDFLQMPPVQQIPPPLGAETLVGGFQQYLMTRIAERIEDDGSTVACEQVFLDRNYRSCEPIVRFCRAVGYEQSFVAENPRRTLSYDDDVIELWDTSIVPNHDVARACLDPARPCVAVTYDDGKNGQANVFEASLVAAAVLQFRESCFGSKDFDERAFWAERVGIVTPHRAQRAVIVDLLTRALAGCMPKALPFIDGAVDTVERFQGGERELILVSFGVGDPDIVRQEEVFLFQKERINVAITRAKCKVVLFTSRDLALHVPDDPIVKQASKVIKHYVYRHCTDELRPFEVSVPGTSGTGPVTVRFRGYGDVASGSATRAA